MKVDNGWVRVHLKAGYWESGVLRRFFEPTDEASSNVLPTCFWNKNCGYDAETACWKFSIPLLHGDKSEDVYIPREYVVGVCVREHGLPLPSEEDIRKVSFVN